MPPTVLGRLQRGLEALYRVETRLDVESFVVDERQRDEALDAPGHRRPREQLLVSQDEGDDELGLALFVDRAALANLERHDPSVRLGDHNFSDFCLAVEGVSHFIYVVMCAAQDRAVTALELELQAEIDKFVSCALVRGDGRDTSALRHRLYEAMRLADDLAPEERERYQMANDQARRYAESLDRRFLVHGRVHAMLGELRQFYRWPLREKLGHIARAA